MDEAVTRFRSVAVAWAPFARRKITTWLSILSGGNWHIRFARALFDDGTPHIKPLRVRTASFQAERRIELLAGNGADVLETVLLDPPRGLASDQVPGLPGASAPPMNGNFFAFGPPPTITQPRQPTLLLPLTSTLPMQSFDEATLNLELYTHEPVIDGVASLLELLGIDRGVLQGFIGPTLEVTVASPVRVGESTRMNNGILHVHLVATATVSPSEVRIAVSSVERGPESSYSVVGSQLSWKEDGAFADGHIDVPMPNEPAVVLYVICREQFAERHVVRDVDISFNERWQLFRAADQKNSFRGSFYDGDRDAFAGKVALLLQLMGLDTLHIGSIPELTDGSDMLAIDRMGRAYVVECTTGDIDKRGKILRLYERADALKANLARAMPLITAVQPVIATSLPASRTLLHRDQLQHFGIAVLCREDIDELVAAVQDPLTLDRLFQWIRARIPQSQADTDGVEQFWAPSSQS